MSSVLGDFIRAARARADLNATEFATRIAHSATWLYRLETGGRVAPTEQDLANISRELNLTSWETRYFYMLAGKPPPPDQSGEAPVSDYIDRLQNPVAWIEAGGKSHYNAEFLRIFKNADEYREMAHWHLEHPKARDIILNWDEISDWWVANGKLRMAAEGRNPHFMKQLEMNHQIPGAKERWDRQVIPIDPANRIWYCYDLDNQCEIALDMRGWRHPYRSGTMLSGFIVDTTPGNT